jgi:hypothetical protein
MPQMIREMPGQVYSILRDDIPAAVFGEQLAPASVLGSLLLLGSMALLFRRHALWALLVFGTVAATLLLSTEARYYMMVLPILLLGWLTLTCALARRLPPKWGEAVLAASLALVLLNNLSASVRFFAEQRHPRFVEYYRKGEFVPLLAMAEQIRQHARPDQKVLGPSGAVLSVFSGRHVVTQRELFPYGAIFRAPRVLAQAKLKFVVFPARLYDKKEPLIARLMRKKIVVPRAKLATVGKTMVLATPQITVVKKDWRKLPRTWRPPSVRKSKKAASAPATRPASAPATQGAPPPHDLRAMTTMLSPVHPAASGPVLSRVAAYEGLLVIRAIAESMDDVASSAPGRASFFTPKYAFTAGASSPTFLSPWMAASRSFAPAGSYSSRGQFP